MRVLEAEAKASAAEAEATAADLELEEALAEQNASEEEASVNLLDLDDDIVQNGTALIEKVEESEQKNVEGSAEGCGFSRDAKVNAGVAYVELVASLTSRCWFKGA